MSFSKSLRRRPTPARALGRPDTRSPSAQFPPQAGTSALTVHPSQNVDYIQWVVDGTARYLSSGWTGSAPYSLAIDTTTFSQGRHTIQPVSFAGPYRNFSPTSVSGCVGWWDFSDLTTMYTNSGKTTHVANDGDKVVVITDKAGVVTDLVASTGPTWNASQYNGLGAAVATNNTNQILVSSAWPSSWNGSSGDVFIVAKPTQASAIILGMSSNTGGSNYIECQVQNTGAPSQSTLNISGSFTTPSSTTRNALGQTISPATFAATPILANMRCNSGASSYDFWLNGNGPVTSSDGARWTSNLSNASFVSLFGLKYNSNSLLASQTQICEIIVYNTTLSLSNRLKVETYLAEKWGIPYCGPTAAPYDNAYLLTQVNPASGQVMFGSSAYANQIAYTQTYETPYVISVNNPTGAPYPATPQHLSHIKTHELQFAAGPLSSDDQNLLNNTLSLAEISDTTIVTTAKAAGCTAPIVEYQIITQQSYYHTLDWLGYARRYGLDEELAFYHVAAGANYKPTVSAWGAAGFPISWFWDAYYVKSGVQGDLFSGGAMVGASGNGGAGGTYLNDTTGVNLDTYAPNPGDYIAFGMHQRFDELDITLGTGANGWVGAIEYVSAVNSDGTPAAWSPITSGNGLLISDGTSGFTLTGLKVIHFNPFPEHVSPTPLPAWVPSYSPSGPHGFLKYGDGTQPLPENGTKGYYLRIKTTTKGTTRPIISRMVMADVTGAGNDYALQSHTGVQPWNNGKLPGDVTGYDLDGDGYLNDTEWAAFTAAGGSSSAPRWRWQSRICTLSGTNVLWTRFTDQNVKNWSAGTLQRLLSTIYDGFRLDNATGTGGFAGQGNATSIESDATYVSEHAATLLLARQLILSNLGRQCILILNISAFIFIPAVTAAAQGVWHEDMVTDLDGWTNFQKWAYSVNTIATYSSPEPMQIVASLSRTANGTTAITDTQKLAALAAYYCLARSTPIGSTNNLAGTLFGPFNNNNQSGHTWNVSNNWVNDRWVPAITVNVGQPNDAHFTTLASGVGGYINSPTGTDPNDAGKTYRVYQRDYANALILYRPLSDNGSGTVGAAGAGSVTHTLPGTYYPLAADGTRGAGVTTYALTNGQGAILMKSP